MSAFLQQYGIAIFTLIIIAIMILMSSGLGNYVEKLLINEITQFTKEINTSNLDKNKPKEETKLNKYGFYYDKKYKTVLGNEEFELYVEFNEDKTIDIFLIVNEEYYEENKEELNNQFGTTNYEEFNDYVAKEYFGDNLTTRTLNCEYANSKVSSDDTVKIGYTFGTFYFSNDGKIMYGNEGKTDIFAELVE